MSLTTAARAAATLALRKRRLMALDVAAAGGTDKIEPGTTFLQWVDKLAANGLKVDGLPFDLSKRAALREIYAAIPSTKDEGYDMMFAIMKGAQTGATVLTFLLQLFLVLKYEPLKVGTYYPDRSLAAYVSGSRFMPVVRSVPVAHRAMLGSNGGGEGNVLTRSIGSSEVLFLWTSGSSATESFPLGAIVADEVQNMLVDDIERIRERMSASDVRFFFACSTAKWPGADIDFLYMKGDQRRFHTRCRCDDGVLLDEVFPDCIQFNNGAWDAEGAPRDYVYTCPTCRAYIADSQAGEWRKHNPSSRHISFHLPQTISPTVSAREVLESYQSAQDLQNFWNRKLGKPWTDPNQVPITLAICERQVEAGRRAGVTWKTRAHGTFMGLDQMGGYIVALVLERMADGRMALVHAEFVYGADTWDRAAELMDVYGVQTCVVEQLPNIDNARAFANRFPGRVWLTTQYSDTQDDMTVWSDQTTRSEKRTIEEDRSRYTVSLHQYKAMQAALYRITKGHCLFPDPNALSQEVIDKGMKVRKPILREVFHHFTKTALVVVNDGPTRKPKAMVQKVAIDPHSSYAFMLANVAWSRSHGGGMIILPEAAPVAQSDHGQRVVETLPLRHGKQMPAALVQVLDGAPEGSCGRCAAFTLKDGFGWCSERSLRTGKAEPICPLYERRDG